MIDYRELLKKYMRCLDEYDGYPDDAIGYGECVGLLTSEEADELRIMWEGL